MFIVSQEENNIINSEKIITIESADGVIIARWGMVPAETIILGVYEKEQGENAINRIIEAYEKKERVFYMPSKEEINDEMSKIKRFKQREQELKAKGEM